jgi:hypothetical protein
MGRIGGIALARKTDNLTLVGQVTRLKRMQVSVPAPIRRNDDRYFDTIGKDVLIFIVKYIWFVIRAPVDDNQLTGT